MTDDVAEPAHTSGSTPSGQDAGRPGPGGGAARFAAWALVVLVVVAAVGSAVVDRVVRRQVVEGAVDEVRSAVERSVVPRLRPEDLGRDGTLTSARRAALRRAVERSVGAAGVLDVGLWDRSGPLGGAGGAGARPLLRTALEGRTASAVRGAGTAPGAPRDAAARRLQVLVPLRSAGGRLDARPPGRVVGAVEVDLRYGPLSARIATETRTLVAVLVVALAVLWIAVVVLALEGSRRLRRQSRENRWLADHDPLTGLANRRRLLEELGRHLGAPGPPPVLVVVDLDRFREVNDALGHVTGDRLLVEVAGRLAAAVPDGALVARLGADEFGVVAGAVGPGGATAVAGRLLGALEAPVELDGLEVEVRASAGVASGSGGADEVDEPTTLLHHADVAVRSAKQSHRAVVVYDPADDVFDERRLRLAADLRRAIAAHELVVHLQPIVEVGSGRPVAAEALVRWDHPERGLLAPEAFLPVVESTEAVKALTIEVLDQALTQARRWADRGWRLDLSVNLAATCLGDPALVAQVGDLLERHGVPAGRLELELTETAVVDSPTRAREVLAELHALGVRLAVDDFGTGYASVAYLTDLPIATLKIDGSFVARLSDRHGGGVTRFSAQLGRTLGLRTVAEGVEDEWTLAEVGELGCDLAQGYFVSRPLPPDDFADWVEAHPPR